MSGGYKGRILDPRAHELSDGTGWTAEVYVAEDIDDETIDTQYVLQRVYPTREAALSAAVSAGKREVDERFKSQETQSVIEQEIRLPSTHCHGLGHQADDVAAGRDGQPKKVPGPENPEDRFN
jgi:hypothetical protein